MRPDCANAAGLFECLQTSLQQLGVSVIYAENCKQLIGIKTDIASTNVVASRLIRLVEKKTSWTFWMWCLVHWVELALKDALKHAAFDLMDDMLIWLLYVYHIQKNVCGGKLFVVFHSTTNLFLRIMALLISNICLQNCYSESFTVNSYFQLKPRKFSLTDVFPCTVYEKSPKKCHEFEEVISDLQQYVFIRWCCNKTYLCKWFQMGLTHIKWHEMATVEIWCML